MRALRVAHSLEPFAARNRHLCLLETPTRWPGRASPLPLPGQGPPCQPAGSNRQVFPCLETLDRSSGNHL